MRLPLWTPEYPGAIVYPADSSNVLLGPGWAPLPPTHIVYHTPEEQADSTPGTPYWFAQVHPGQEGSTNAFADWLGNLWECVPPTITPIANGVLGRPYPPGANPTINFNRTTRSLEVQGYAHNINLTMPRGSGQWKTVVAWGTYQSILHNIPIDRNHHIGHYQVANNRSDPGTLDLDALVEDIWRKANKEDWMALTDLEQTELLTKVRRTDEWLSSLIPFPQSTSLTLQPRIQVIMSLWYLFADDTDPTTPGVQSRIALIHQIADKIAQGGGPIGIFPTPTQIAEATVAELQKEGN